MSNSLQLAHQWWAALDQANRQRVWNSRYWTPDEHSPPAHA
ncbi:MAG: hypothetical protein ACRDS0_18845 [Pseudonocardiaceae bacterium]